MLAKSRTMAEGSQASPGSWVRGQVFPSSWEAEKGLLHGVGPWYKLSSDLGSKILRRHSDLEQIGRGSALGVGNKPSGKGWQIALQPSSGVYDLDGR